MPTENSILLERNGDEWVTSYDVWAKRGSYPLDVGDGVFVGNITIDPEDTSTVYDWTPPTDGTWYYGALSIYHRTPGLFFQLNGG